MALIPWKSRQDEGRQLARGQGFRGELDRLFDSFFGETFGDLENTFGQHGAWGPPVDVEETDKEIHVRAEIPGVNADDLNLSIHERTLVLSGEKKETEERKEAGFIYQERSFGSFRREVMLPSAVDEADVQAEYKDGVLNITLKKSQEALPKRIPVKSS